MKAILKALVLLPVAAVVLAVAFANRHAVRVSFDPFNSETPAFDLSVPLFVILFTTLMLGVLVGGIASWLSQAKHRRAARQYRAEAARLRAEAMRFAEESGQGGKPIRVLAGSAAA